MTDIVQEDVVVAEAAAQEAVPAEVPADVPAEAPVEASAAEKTADPNADAVADAGDKDEIRETLREIFEDTVIDKFYAEVEETGMLSEESFELLREADPRLAQMAKVMLDQQQKAIEAIRAEMEQHDAYSIEMRNTYIQTWNDRILEAIGGEEGLAEIAAFKENNLSAKERAEFEAIAEKSGQAALDAFLKLKEQRDEKFGKLPSVSAPTVEDAAEGTYFKTKEEYQAALGDIRYRRRDPAFMQETDSKLMKSLNMGIKLA